MVRYTDPQILEMLVGYRSLIDSVNDRLRLASLNEHGIYTIAHTSNNFLIVNEIVQQSVGSALVGRIDEPLVVTRRMVLNTNPDMSENKDLLYIFAETPLKVQTNPFVLVAYDKPALDYVLANSEQVEINPQSMKMKTKTGVYFYLTGNENVNSLLERIL
ncbi:hypothetical protein HQ489_04790 [Candidatus Woesearchaeota archaeon]|nr:hypothetical protein [Candidatus Woesearchaeota archaeon]